MSWCSMVFLNGGSMLQAIITPQDDASNAFNEALKIFDIPYIWKSGKENAD